MSNIFNDFDVDEALISLEKIREVLVVGLGCYGEIERLRSAQKIEAACGRETPQNLRVIHPAAYQEAVSDFAAALDYVDQFMHQIRDWAAAGLSRAPEEPEARFTESERTTKGSSQEPEPKVVPSSR